eukprot:428858-Pelagomonas_calceolata.AAC.1
MHPSVVWSLNFKSRHYTRQLPVMMSKRALSNSSVANTSRDCTSVYSGQAKAYQPTFVAGLHGYVGFILVWMWQTHALALGLGIMAVEARKLLALSPRFCT